MMAWIGGQDKMDTIYLGAGQAWRAGPGEASGQRESGWVGASPTLPSLLGGELVAPNPAPTMQSRETQLSGVVRQPALPPGHP